MFIKASHFLLPPDWAENNNLTFLLNLDEETILMPRTISKQSKSEKSRNKKSEKHNCLCRKRKRKGYLKSQCVKMKIHQPPSSFHSSCCAFLVSSFVVFHTFSFSIWNYYFLSDSQEEEICLKFLNFISLGSNYLWLFAFWFWMRCTVNRREWRLKTGKGRVNGIRELKVQVNHKPKLFFESFCFK